MSKAGKVLRVVVELNHILHRLCGPPSIPLSFNLATVLPRRSAYCVSCDTEEVIPRRLALIVYSVDYQGI